MYGGALQDLIDELGRLPGVGPKSAQRMAFHILEAERDDAERLVTAIKDVKEKVLFCATCFNISEEINCSICANPHRDAGQICVVEAPRDIQAIEKTRSYNGRYHVLGGAINPMSGIGPDQLRIRELVARLGDDTVQELILATNPNLEGEATATYLVRLLADVGLTISRLASGLPVGGDLEYADEITLGLAFEGRRVVSRKEPAALLNAAAPPQLSAG